MWETLYADFWDKLERFCRRLCRDDGRAEDLAQEVFLKALQNRALFETLNERQAKAWLFAAARNLYCDQVRRSAKEQQLLASLGAAAALGEDETAAAALSGVEWNSLLEQLDPGDQLLLTLRYEAGYTAAELARAMGLPPGTVRTRLFSARNRLKQKLT